MNFTITNKKYKEKFENEESKEFKDLADEINTSVTKALEKKIKFASSKVVRFSKEGDNINCQMSVVVSKTSDATEEMIRKALGEELGNLTIKNVVVVDTEKTTTTRRTEKPTEKPTAEEEIIFVVIATLKDEIYNNKLGDSSSDEFKTLARKLIEPLTVVLKGKYGKAFLRVVIIAFRKGSVVCEFNVITKEDLKATNDDVKDILQKASERGEIGNYTLTGIQVERKMTRKQQTGDEEKTLPSWAFVAIAVFGVLMMLIIVIIYLTCRRRTKRSHNLEFLDVYENCGIALEEVEVGKPNMNHDEDD